jgi:hypothetical protein
VSARSQANAVPKNRVEMLRGYEYPGFSMLPLPLEPRKCPSVPAGEQAMEEIVK